MANNGDLRVKKIRVHFSLRLRIQQGEDTREQSRAATGHDRRTREG
jgi:hypothetical protein